MGKKVCILLLIILCLAGCGSREKIIFSGSGCRFSLPEDFTKMDVEGFDGFYSADDGSSVNLNIQPADPAFENVSADLLHSTLSSVLSQTYEKEVIITDHSFTRDPVCGYPAYQYSLSYTLRGDEITQLVIGVNADRCYTFTYTDLSGDWSEAFLESAKSIQFLSE